MTLISGKIKLRRDTESNWVNNNPVLDKGEPGFVTDTNLIKIGDGETAFTDLPYLTLDSFLNIKDTPSTYTGYEGYVVMVNSDGTGLQFSKYSSGLTYYDGAIAGEQTTGTVFEAPAQSDFTLHKFKISLKTKPEGQDFIVKVYKNGTEVASATITTTDTATNGLYVATTTDINVDYLEDDNVKVEITQVGSNVAGSDFTRALS